ncbi:MAG: 50S ribosomal protein L17 [Candidatus Yanofskybacteria bacterium RIFCSPLOWO2_01_FULL_49_25]|uniref:50S ribosomal protein L17 n=1 Tax=Candidatus Yanofskybacteria bacterium RIFCSPLOWO2_01_FULL_49_25 TaxID=1802701 RepID=A0A1F8GQZ1_9BACT|nr:MAG: 50S ribosomal protein L17 [Candidatus Yanofskybacteria bacterium RIFCSPLOWO2_01_FULL_49_25]
MYHRKRGRKFGRENKQRTALMRSLAVALIQKGRISTTLAKAKELRGYVEKLVTRSKNPTVATKRLLATDLDPSSVSKLVKDLGPKFKERSGGYIRIANLGARTSDGAAMAIIQFVD